MCDTLSAAHHVFINYKDFKSFRVNESKHCNVIREYVKMVSNVHNFNSEE